VEWEGAVRPHARSRASYVRDDWIPVHEAGLLEVHGADGPEEILPGLTLERVGGHTPGLSLVRLDGGADGDVLCVGDLVPTGAHVPVPWIMGYDLDPPRQVELKEARLPRWADEGTLVVFPHETRYPWARIARDDRGRFRPEPLDEGWLEPLRSAPWPLEP
jgi:glyoxylase-like metal-dependent hydrolase (beta-lactamase superfamily II)